MEGKSNSSGIIIAGVALVVILLMFSSKSNAATGGSGGSSGNGGNPNDPNFAAATYMGYTLYQNGAPLPLNQPARDGLANYLANKTPEGYAHLYNFIPNITWLPPLPQPASTADTGHSSGESAGDTIGKVVGGIAHLFGL